MKKSPDAVIFRSIAAVLGGYVVSNLIAIVLAVILPIPQIDGVMIGMSASFAVYAAAAIWAFSASTAKRAWSVLLAIFAFSLSPISL